MMTSPPGQSGWGLFPSFKATDSSLLGERREELLPWSRPSLAFELPVACQASHDVRCSDGEVERRWGLLPEEPSVLGYCHHPFFWLLHVDGLLAWEYSLSEPGTPGPFTQYSLKHHHTLVHGWCWLAWMILVGVSLYAIVSRKSKGITNTWTQLLWFLQTFLFGMASLYYLIAFRPKHQKQT